MVATIAGRTARRGAWNKTPGIVMKTPQRPPLSPVAVSGQAVVIDADTIDVKNTRIRPYGLDTPESRQTCRAAGQRWACGEQATRALTDRIGTQEVQ